MEERSLELKDIDRQVVADLYRLRPSVWMVDLFLDWTSIIAIFWVYRWFNSLLLLPLAALLIGSRQHALGLLGHDATHRLAFRARKTNDFFGNVFIAWPLFVDLTNGYRPWHFKHHKELGTSEDPELSYRGLSEYQGEITWARILAYFIYDLSGLGALDLFRFMKAIFPYHNPSRFIGPICLWGAFAAITFGTNNQWIFYLWSWSLIAGFWPVFRLRTWTEHVAVNRNGAENTHRFYANPIARFLFCPHHTDHHYEHHRWPQVPYYNLPQLRRLGLSSRSVQNLHQLFPNMATQGKAISRSGIDY